MIKKIDTARKTYTIDSDKPETYVQILKIAKKYEARGTVQSAEAACDIYSQLGLENAAKRASKLRYALERVQDDNDSKTAELSAAE